MKTRRTLGFAGIFVLSTFLLNIGCDETTLAPLTTATLTGRIVESVTLQPVEGALVRTIPELDSTLTDANGQFTISVELFDTTRVQVTLRISRQGYVTTTTGVLTIQNNMVTTVPDFPLTLQSQASEEDATPAAVILNEINNPGIFVSGSGAEVNARLVFEVRARSGRPLNEDGAVQLKFDILGGPQGGEFLEPDTATTNAIGQASTVLHSGTIAGALQIVASVVGTSIQSAPVPVSIRGGLPDATHFSAVSYTHLTLPTSG